MDTPDCVFRRQSAAGNVPFIRTLPAFEAFFAGNVLVFWTLPALGDVNMIKLGKWGDGLSEREK